MHTTGSKTNVESVVFGGKEYEYSGRLKKRRRNTILCPFCNKKLKQLSAGKKGEIVRTLGHRSYFIKQGGKLFYTLLEILDERFAKEALEKINENYGCKHCIERSA